MDFLTEKNCTKCGTVKPVADFPRDKRLRTGLSSQCRACHAARFARHYARDKANIISKSRRWIKAHPDRARELALKHKSSEGYRSKARKRYQENKDRYKAASRNWQQQNPERYKQLVRRWLDNNPHRYKELVKRGIFKRRNRLAFARCDLTAHQWEAIKLIWNNACAYCRHSKPLTQDHVVPVSKGGEHTASNIVPACRSCNSRKGNKLLKTRPTYPNEILEYIRQYPQSPYMGLFS